MKRKSSIISTIYNISLVLIILGVFSMITQVNSTSSVQKKKDTLTLAFEDVINPTVVPVSSDNTTNIEALQSDKTDKILVKIYANANEHNDFYFIVDGEERSWNEELAGIEVTEIFGVTVTQATETTNAKIAVTGSTVAVLEKIFATENINFEKAPTWNLFRLEVYSDGLMKSVELYQDKYTATGLTISDYSIIF